MSDDDLFGGAYPDPPAEPQETESYGVRLTKRQKADVSMGIHPLTRIALRGDDETCGTCTYRRHVGGHARDYPKCWHPASPRTGGPATDVRAWWPACTRWEAQP